ncbi:uncharacterized protein LOC114523788 [Dendronephthya gigantea]|uniref:uncharacterized protein LOC114523788 n=1 Tax=Dendronephthya gigantea TaxID=151771 RepID=UPI00106BEF02|nr:uncharacterized protein LOC114523788 [Dendronephthya gigantea]
MSSLEREESWESEDPDSSSHQTPRESEAKEEVLESKYTETEELQTDAIYEVLPKNQQPSNDVYDTLQDTKACYENVSQKLKENKKERIQENKPKKDVEKIEDVFEMAKLFKLLHIKHDSKKLDLDEMLKTVKKELKKHSSGSGKYSNGTTGYKVIAKAKAEDMLKREKLEKLYSEVEDCVKQLDDRAIEVLDVYYGDKGVLKALEEQKKSLTNTEYNVLIAGESSSGKSSLLNLILGEELLAHHVLNTTSTICELKFGEKREMIVHYKYDEEKKSRPLPEILTLESEDNYYSKIATFVQVKPNEREKGSDYARVEIFWPHELLEEGVVIIDSPGLGESDEMDEVLMNYLPNAFAFIYVLDTFHAGGIQKDIKEKLMDILKVVQSSDGGVENLQNLAECSLFVCNKWDLVKEDERPTVKKYVTAKLSECWENSNLNHQMVYMSITDAIKAQEYGGVTEEFNLLLKQIKTMVLKAINIRLYNHWQWLYAVLHHIHRVTYFFNQEIQSTHQETCERMASIEKRIEKIEKQEQEVRKSMETRVQYQTKVLNGKLVGYVHSTDFETKLCTWVRSSSPPPGVDWETTKSNVKKAIDYKFKELLIQWEKESHVYDEIHRKLLDEFRTRLNLLEEELQGVDKAMHIVERQTDYTKNKSKIPTAAKVLFGATSPLWIPFGVAGLVFGIPVLGALAVRQKVDEKKKLDAYKKNPLDYLKRRSRKYLERLPKLHVLQYAQRQMEHTRMVLSKYADQLPILIEADRKLVKQLTNETRSHDDIFKLYDPIQKQSARIIDTIIPLGVELCPATVNANDLDWKEESVSSLGEGEFSTVYKGKLNDAGGTESDISQMDVAVKVFTHPFDAPNTKFFLYEEVHIRDLEHKNVLKYFGAARITSLSSNMYQFIFVTKACRENLRSVIFRNRNLTPAKSENTKLAIGKFFNWAMDIADGLNYIHERGLIHRHLKLENVLENEDGTAMISDIGIVGRFLETEKSIIYLAPEVLKVLTNRTKESDIYSYGIVLWEMWYGMPAFMEHMPIKKAQFQKMIANGIRPKADNKKISIPAIHDVMKNCWATEAEKRYSAKKCSGKFRELQNEPSETEDTTF